MSLVRRFLDLNSGHLPASDRALLEQAARFGVCEGLSACFGGPYGWFIHVPDEPTPLVWEGTDTLNSLFELARQRGCDYVLLDADGSVDPTLAFFDEA